jgi:AP-3 complex subunit delta
MLIIRLTRRRSTFVAGLRQTFNKLQQSLEDANSAVVSCAVNVITELSDKNPRNYLHLGM